MFSCVIASATTTEVLSGGMGGSRNGALQLVSFNYETKLIYHFSPLIFSRHALLLFFLIKFVYSFVLQFKMHAELQVLSPLVPIRDVNFLRFCKQLTEGCWAVVDVSIDGIRENASALADNMKCRRLPSGCLVQDLPNGYCKVFNSSLPFTCTTLFPLLL